MKLILAIVPVILGFVTAHPHRSHGEKIQKIQDDLFDQKMHSSDYSYDYRHITISGNKVTEEGLWSTNETESEYWYNSAEAALKSKLQRELNTRLAKNVIFFLGDGMSIPTLMAARAYLGQLEGKTGEEGSLYWEKFPFSGLSKTWCLDKQVGDSACTSTAYLGGVKTKSGTLGLNGKVVRGKCETQIDEANHVHSIAKWAQDHGKASGIVTTTRVTHASPGGAYSHIADRNWESDSDIIAAGYDPKKCQDIATQLVRQEPGKKFKVVLGGGRRSFLPKTTIDEEGDAGSRLDGINLIDEWKREKEHSNSRPVYVWNRTALNDVIEHPDNYDYVLGLFDASHCPYHLEASPVTEPTLSEMTEAAVKILSKDKAGYFLFVEGGRIDHAHHNTYATLALDETVELAKAVKKAREMTSEDDTLIIVTSDHAHTMSVAGYPKRGNKINSISGMKANDGIPYQTLSYANGPGYRAPKSDGSRYNPAEGNYDDPRYMSTTLVPLGSETHGGDDVAIFASGPWAHLFTGTIEQSDIPHYLGYASCVGKNKQPACASSSLNN